ncbi:MAG TPA: diphosphate--fructose-6-phosphate 1-phosphotransferase [Pyrinomonadaceae bacterium]|jgi:6-phosphofructokinase 1|nr:diphosphate--fructose-6-phosphate 1-phosphotransferase [Pyrinomonadaceae bacterium]
MSTRQVLAILVGGGPAPGINAVISAAAIEAINEGFEVVGVQDGFKWLIREDASKIRPLGISDVSRIYLKGGSVLGTARDNPTKSEKATRAVVETLRAAGVTHLVTIGGDDTALSASFVAERSNHGISVAHVPKTIDNDLPLPSHIPTFGYQTARHVGVELVYNLMEDARSTKRWYVVVAMGRKAGFLALGIGKAAGATLTVIGEEFTDRSTVAFAEICDIVEGAVIKRRASGRNYGVAVLAEGLIEKLDPEELADLQDVERDEHGHIRFAEVDLARKVKAEVQGRLAGRGIRLTITNKNIGYELRCADPIPFDASYCRDLGYSAIRFLRSGGSGALISIQGGRMVPIPFADIREPGTGKTRVRLVNVESEGYRVAREYMIRLEPADFADNYWMTKLAAAGNMTVDEFRDKFGYMEKGKR